MINTYKKPETTVVKVQTQQILQTSIEMGEGTKATNLADGRAFDFFAFEEEEETPGKSDEDDSWEEDWEDEE